MVCNCGKAQVFGRSRFGRAKPLPELAGAASASARASFTFSCAHSDVVSGWAVKSITLEHRPKQDVALLRPDCAEAAPALVTSVVQLSANACAIAMVPPSRRHCACGGVKSESAILVGPSRLTQAI